MKNTCSYAVGVGEARVAAFLLNAWKPIATLPLQPSYIHNLHTDVFNLSSSGYNAAG